MTVAVAKLKGSAFLDALAEWVVPLSLVWIVGSVEVTSNLGFNLAVIDGIASQLVVYGYCFMVLVTMRFSHVLKLHFIMAMWGAGLWVARGISFGELVFGQGRWDLFGSIQERWGMILLILFWHGYEVMRIGLSDDAG